MGWHSTRRGEALRGNALAGTATMRENRESVMIKDRQGDMTEGVC